MEFKKLNNEELNSINGGGVGNIFRDYIISKAIDYTVKAAVNYANNPYPVGSGCSELE